MKIEEIKTECPFCHMKDQTRLLYKIFGTEQWICDRCLRQWTIKWEEVPVKPVPKRA